MLKRFLQAMFVLLALMAAYLALLASEWLPLPSQAQRDALVLLEQPPPPAGGRSAYAVLWFLQYDLQGADPDELMAREAQKLSSHRGDVEEFTSVAANFPDVGTSAGAACVDPSTTCLAEARDPDSPGVALLAQHAALAERAQALRGASHYRYPFAITDPLMIPRNGRVISLLRFANARRFVSGDMAGGLADACSDLATWRRLRPTTDLLIHDMMAVAFAQSNARLVSEMLVEWPVGQPLPAACGDALAPLAESELDQCDAWRGEFTYMRVLITRAQEEASASDTVLPGWASRALVNQRNQEYIQAPAVAAGCNDAPSAPERRLRLQDWLFDPIGAYALKQVEPDNLWQYRERFDDYLDALRALRLQAWLRDQPDLPAAWADPAPEHLPLPERLTLNTDRRELSLEFRRKLPNAPDRWILPLPPPLPARPPAG